MYYIYKITCKINNKIYIGKSTTTIESRWASHIRDSYYLLQNGKYKLNTHLARAIRLYGPNNFVLEEIDNTEDYQELSQKEKYWIAHYNAITEGFNETSGGDGGNTYINKTQEELKLIREKIKQSKLGGNNPNSQRVKCKNIVTNEEYFFNSLSECQIFLQETNHQFISRRINGSTKTPWKNTWIFAKFNEDYPPYTKTLSNQNSVKIQVIDLLNTDSQIQEFESFSAAERFYQVPSKSFALSRQKDKTKKEYIVKNRYKVIILE